MDALWTQCCTTPDPLSTADIADLFCALLDTTNHTQDDQSKADILDTDFLSTAHGLTKARPDR